MKKKLIASVLCLTLSSTILVSFPIYAKDIQEQNINAYHQRYNNSENQYKKLFKNFNTSSTNKNNSTFKFNSDNVYPDDYAGAYLDYDGNLHVNLTSNDNIQQYKSLINDSSIIFENKKNPLNKILLIQKILNDYMIPLGIKSTSVMEQTDTLDIKLQSADSEGAINKILTKYGYDNGCINYYIQTDDNMATSAKAIYPGSGVVANGLSGTIGFLARDDSTGQYGIVTCAHVAPPMTNVYDSVNTFIGVPTKVQYSGNLDASFVPFSNQSNWSCGNQVYPDGQPPSNYFITTTSSNSNGVLANSLVYKYGRQTGFNTGYILSTSTSMVTTYLNVNHLLTDGMEFSNVTNRGDSGGPVYQINVWTSSSSALVNLIGITNAQDSSLNGFGIKISYILSRFNLTPVL